MTRDQACLAMWWSMDAQQRPEFEHWHSHEHFPERLRIPGFLRASRWLDANGGEGVFVMYELASHETLSSPAYLERLNAPSPWSQRMMPLHRSMVRCQCQVLASAGGTVARHALTVQLSPAAGRSQELRGALAGLTRELAGRPGFAGGHLLQHQAPGIAETTEQKIRGGDAAADWIFVATAYEAPALESLLQSALAEDALLAMGAAAGAVRGSYLLSHSATPADVAGE
ncbi:MAG: hypothetical protein JWQ76_1919 [Ramlibacter sp.]|nr:hypothetical protein [Ramlibacter sp.]